MTLVSFRRFSHALAAVALVLFAAPAFAGTMLFAEVLTSEQSWLGSNLRGTFEAGDLDADPSDIMLKADVTAGAGIGDGRVSGAGDSVLFTHTFTPSKAFTSITSAHLLIGLRDDAFFDGRESATISLNDNFWQSGSASWISLFNGEVTALFANNEDEITVAVMGRRGDFIVDSSLMVWTYETAGDIAVPGGGTGTGAQPVPEPTGLALFCVGAVVLRKATRQQG